MILEQDLSDSFKKHEIPAYRVNQVMHAVYKAYKSDYQNIFVLPKDLRDLLNENFPVFSFAAAKQFISRRRNAVKTVFQLKDGKQVEGVLMRFKNSRNSVCVSSQVGCGLKCVFCATGRMGFIRNLTCEEIFDQVLYFEHFLKKTEERVTHVVFMGMGEPLLNYEKVMKSIRFLNDSRYLGIAARHITISTSGIIPNIEKLKNEDMQINLAVSLHAPNQELREKLMPVAKSYKLPELMRAVKDYIEKTRRRVSYEYVMLRGVNDSENCAKELAKLLRGQMCHINLIPYNPQDPSSCRAIDGFQNAGKAQIEKFALILKSFNIPVTVRVSLGQDIAGACGQLSIQCP